MNFVSSANATVIMQAIAAKFESLGGYTFRGSVAFANLPATLTPGMTGYVYNVTDNFTTDARFVEGAGKKYSAGTNVAVCNIGVPTYSAVTPLGTENPRQEGWYEEVSTGVYKKTTDVTVDGSKTYYEQTANDDMKFDVVGNFIDVDAIYNLIADDFDATAAYNVGDIVIHDGGLFVFTTAHAAGAWDPTEVDQVTVADLIADAEPEELTAQEVATLVGLLD